MIKLLSLIPGNSFKGLSHAVMNSKCLIPSKSFKTLSQFQNAESVMNSLSLIPGYSFKTLEVNSLNQNGKMCTV